ncbi:hypothetical protein H2200_009737 [Cladophialophora chaetospira]|uniref:F-box domain-containing protein n=1 Tax=Cladophialophora chaetospira TaxID=386627 RepID=A0AA39CF04_9EURO|nr:hypothetical protein H2200_009737 [Cladophialophora chaetospira]
MAPPKRHISLPVGGLICALDSIPEGPITRSRMKALQAKEGEKTDIRQRITMFIDLPLEVLEMVTAYMAGGDLKSLLRVSKNLHESLKVQLYRRVKWRFAFPRNGPGTFCQCMQPHLPAYTKTRNGHAFAATTSNDHTIAPKIRHLSIKWRPCHQCPAIREVPRALVWNDEDQPYCGQIDASLLQQFSNLKSLQLKGQWETLLTRIPPLGNLEDVSLAAIVTPYPCRISFDLIVNVLIQPKLRERMSIRSLEASEVAKLLSGKVSTKSITSLTLNRIEAEPCLLEGFLSELTGLKSLMLMRSRHPGFLTDYIGLKPLRLKDIESAMSPLADSLEHLILVDDQKSLRESARVYLTDTSLVSSLRSFHLLKSIAIDPSALIGRDVCPLLCSSSNLLPLNTFAEKLPDQVELLGLVLEPDQLFCINGYLNELMESILRERSRLIKLKRVVFLDNLCLTLGELCKCDWDYYRCANHRQANKWFLETEERMAFKELAERSKAVGIDLRRWPSDNAQRCRFPVHKHGLRWVQEAMKRASNLSYNDNEIISRDYGRE